MIPYTWFEQARARIAPHINHTQTTHDPARNWYIKWENQQITGSFKARGALNKVLSLAAWELDRGIVTASAGNHGQGVALAGKLVQARVTVFVPASAVPKKVQAIRKLGAKIQTIEGGYEEAERAGIEFAASNGLTWVSAYNDGQVIAGQGTIALEVQGDWPQLSKATWLVPVGGGGLISGIAAALKSAHLPDGEVKVIGVQSQASAFMHHLFHYGTQDGVQDLPSLADGLAGAVEHNSITIPLVKKFVDDIILVSEQEISQAIAFAWHNYKEKIEGSAAAALAGLLRQKITERPLVCVISGGNIQPEIHERIITSFG